MLKVALTNDSTIILKRFFKMGTDFIWVHMVGHLCLWVCAQNAFSLSYEAVNVTSVQHSAKNTRGRWMLVHRVVCVCVCTYVDNRQATIPDPFVLSQHWMKLQYFILEIVYHCNCTGYKVDLLLLLIVVVVHFSFPAIHSPLLPQCVLRASILWWQRSRSETINWINLNVSSSVMTLWCENNPCWMDEMNFIDLWEDN